MAIVNRAQYFLDLITEVTAKKSGILLTKSNLITLAHKHDDMADLLEICKTDARRHLRIRPEELEELISILRNNIGNLPDGRNPTIVLSDLMKPYAKSKLDHLHLAMAAERAALSVTLTGQALTEAAYNVECPELVQHGISFPEFLQIQGIYRQYDVMFDSEMPESKDWDGTLTLNSLFNTEIAPTVTDCYFDQRFIDYLAGNEQDLRSIHWRNFERLVTEYYRRHGYHVYFKKPMDSRPGRPHRILEAIREYFFSCAWYEVYDFMEHVLLYEQTQNLVQRTNDILAMELSGYRFIESAFVPVTDEIEIEAIQKAISEGPFSGVHAHLRVAMEHLSRRNSPDYRNSIKESISAVESMAREISGNPKATLGDALAVIEKNGHLHPALKKGFSAIYGYTSDEAGIRHAMLDEPNITVTDAKFFLVSCSTFINYLKSNVAP